MKNISIISLVCMLTILILMMNACENPFPISCTDGLMNQGEIGVDCGGTCPPCNAGSSCTDGILNGLEVSIDCGGACPPCFGVNLCADGIQNNGEEGIDCGGECAIPCNPCDISISNNITNFNESFTPFCSYSEFSTLYRINGYTFTADLKVELGTSSELPEIGEYFISDYNNPGDGEVVISMYIGIYYYYANAGEIYVLSHDPLTVVMCDLEMSASSSSYQFTTDLRIICD